MQRQRAGLLLEIIGGVRNLEVTVRNMRYSGIHVRVITVVIQ